MITKRHRYETDGASRDPSCRICQEEIADPIHYTDIEADLLATITALSQEIVNGLKDTADQIDRAEKAEARAIDLERELEEANRWN